MPNHCKLFFGLLACAVLLAPSVALAKSLQSTFVLGPAGVALQADGTLLVATQLSNSGDRNAFRVRVDSIRLLSESGELSAALLTPSAFPVLVGELDVGQSATIQASFLGDQLIPRTRYRLVMDGGYRPVDRGTSRDRGHVFTVSTSVLVPATAPGSSPFRSVVLGPHRVSGAPFPPRPPVFDDEVNEPSAPVPHGTFVAGTPTPTATTVTPAPFGDPPAIVFTANTGLGIATATDGSIAEPSGATGGGVVFVSANAYAAYSTDGGSHFTRLDPTTIFPNDLGFCCDQIVQYAPSIDRFVWLLQGQVPLSTGHGYRLAVASPADIAASGGTAWTYWIALPSAFGCTGFDYPDLAVGSHDLYMSWDAEGGPCSDGMTVARTSLASLQAGGQITVHFTDPTDGGITRGGHLTQNAAGTMVWAGHNGDNTLRVYSWPEGANPYSWQDIALASWASPDKTISLTPDGKNWFLFGSGFPGAAVIGATRSGSEFWLAWNAGKDGNFPQAHIEMVRLEQLLDFQLVQQVQIWNEDYAFAYPSLSIACTGEVGLSFEFGGGGNYENHVVGFWGDFVAYITTGSDAGTTRFGDYVTIRRTPSTVENPGNLLDAFGYGLIREPPPGAGVIPDVHHVQFGRPASSCVSIPH